MVKALVKLGFEVQGDEISVPSWRQDVEHYADIAEEVARFHGYDVIEPTMFRGATAQGGFSPRQSFRNEIGALCRGMGFFEVMTYSFTSPSAWTK
jgi:phenylalanyl-tRNA synthetase beta chain